MSESKSTFPHIRSRHRALEPGSLVGRNYEILRPIGQGGMSRVYAAVNIWTRREVAVKVLALPRMVDSKGYARFIAEAKTSARLTHPNIVRVLDLGTDESGMPFIVQEFVEGESLAACIERIRRLSMSTAIKVFVPILDALTMAHDHGVVHRDVTPNNILLATQSTGGIVPKLADFGVAKEMALENSLRITDDGTLLGTPLYMSPEQVRAESDIDGRSDVWSAGACLYLAVTGKVPFSGKSLVELAAQIIMAPVKKPSERHAKLPAALDDIILRALEKVPNDRYPSARAFRDALRTLQDAPRAPQDSVEPDDSQISRLLDTAPQTPLTVSVETLPSGTMADLGSLRAASRARPLRVGMVLRNAEAHAKIEEAFATAFGIRCDVWCYFDYAELVDALAEREVEFAWLPPVAFVRASRAQTTRLLLTVERSGQSTYASALLARKGTFERLEDLKLARAVWVDPWSAAGYLMPLALLRAQNINPAEVFSSQAFVGSHDAVLDALVARTAEVGATHCIVDGDGNIVQSPWEAGDELNVLGVTGSIPGDTFCSAPKVSQNLRRMVCNALLDADRAAPVLEALGATRMVEGNPNAYAELERALMGGDE
jgi:eukaryotic-like serine/threonine-protein kinase